MPGRAQDAPVPAEAGLPARGRCGDGGSQERLCSRVVSGVVTNPAHRTCNAPAAIHVIWEDTGDGVEQSCACAEHAPEVTARWKPLGVHALGGCCGMPGAVWDRDNNVCIYEDGLPTREPARAVALEVPA